MEKNIKALLWSTLIFLLCGFLGACKILTDLAPVHEDTSKVQDWIVCPVFFATTRKPDSKQEFTEEPSYDMFRFGVRNVIVPAPTKVALQKDTMDKLGWKLIHLDKPLENGLKPEIPADCKVKDQDFTKEEVAAFFDKYQDESGIDKIVFFVHGCCATFQTSLERAAKLESHMKRPLVVFDWASPRGFTKYLQNETLAEQNYDRFYAFMNAVEEKISPHEIILLGHSMGTRILEEGLLRRSERARLRVPYEKFSETIFCQPDSDARYFINHNKEIVSQSERTEIFYNSMDGRLEASGTAHGGYPRLGRPGELLNTLCKFDNQSMIDVTAAAMGHEIAFWVVSDFSNKVDVKSQGYEMVEDRKNHFILKHKLN